MIFSIMCAKLDESETLKGNALFYSSHKRKTLLLYPFLWNLTLILFKKIQLVVW